MFVFLAFAVCLLFAQCVQESWWQKKVLLVLSSSTSQSSRDTFGTCSGGGGHFRREGARQNIECTGAEQKVECLSRKEEFELDSFAPVRHNFAMNPGLI